MGSDCCRESSFPSNVNVNRQHRSVDESKFELVRGHDDDDDDGAAAAGLAGAGAVTGRHPKPDFSPHGFRQCHTRVSSVVSSRVDPVSLYGAVRYSTTDDTIPVLYVEACRWCSEEVTGPVSLTAITGPAFTTYRCLTHYMKPRDGGGGDIKCAECATA